MCSPPGHGLPSSWSSPSSCEKNSPRCFDGTCTSTQEFELLSPVVGKVVQASQLYSERIQQCIATFEPWPWTRDGRRPRRQVLAENCQGGNVTDLRLIGVRSSAVNHSLLAVDHSSHLPDSL